MLSQLMAMQSNLRLQPSFSTMPSHTISERSLPRFAFSGRHEMNMDSNERYGLFRRYTILSKHYFKAVT